MTDFWTIFFAVFFAVFLALWWMHGIKKHEAARKRHRAYCQKEAIAYQWRARIASLSGHDHKMYNEQAAWWEKISKNWILTQSEHSEQEDQELDDTIRQLIQDHSDWTVKLLLEKGEKLLTGEKS